MKKPNPYNTITFVIFTLLITGSFTYFTRANNDKNLTLFEDFDRDGLSNSEEKTLGTDPKNHDTDGDGYSDGVEVQSGYNPLISAPGDRIVRERKPAKISAVRSQTTNVTQKISEKVISHLADVQESGETEISSEDFSNVISDAIDQEVTFAEVPPVDISDITIKKQDYDDLSEKKKEKKMKEDAVTYFTTISYIFISNFPQGFFDRSADVVQNEILQQMSNLSGEKSDLSYFSDLAENAISAEDEMADVIVPEEMLDIHAKGIYLLRYTKSLYASGDYKKINTDAASMIATLAQFQGLIETSSGFQEKILEKVQKYDIQDTFLDF